MAIGLLLSLPKIPRGSPEDKTTQNNWGTK